MTDMNRIEITEMKTGVTIAGSLGPVSPKMLIFCTYALSGVLESVVSRAIDMGIEREGAVALAMSVNDQALDLFAKAVGADMQKAYDTYADMKAYGNDMIEKLSEVLK